YYNNGQRFPDGLWEQALVALKEVEQATGKGFGDPENSLLVSVRSGAKFSMPGMMDTVLNLGLNETTLQGLARLTGNERFAYDAYRRFIQMFSKIVLDIPAEQFERILEAAKEHRGVQLDTDLDTDALKEVAAGYRELVRRSTGRDFPADPLDQLRLAIEAALRPRNNPRALA